METKPTETTAVSTTNDSMQLTSVDLTKPLPNLENAQQVPFDLMADYWTPEVPGESKRMFFDRIGVRGVKDLTTDEVIELECAFFLEQVNGEVKSISNGSKRLVGAIQANGIKRGTPLEVKYLGKKKNKTNSFQSDSWSVKPLIIKL
jgi:hypothetical protein